MHDFQLTDKVIVVTGGAGRLGSQFAQAILQHGGKVALLDPTFEAASVFSEREARLKIDITEPQQIQQAIFEIKEQLGDLYGLVNAAAIQPDGFFQSVEEYKWATWRKVMAVNLDGLFLCSQAVGKELATNGRGSIVNISSIYGISGAKSDLYEGLAFNTPPSYAATKSAIIGLTRYLATYWGAKNVRVNAISPGGVEDGQSDAFLKRYREQTPMRRMAQKHEINGALIYLLSDASAYVTGHNLVVDGGWTAW